MGREELDKSDRGGRLTRPFSFTLMFTTFRVCVTLVYVSWHSHGFN